MAWARLRQIELGLYDLLLIDKLDAIWYAAESARYERLHPGKGSKAQDEAPVSDSKGIKRILKSLAARAMPMKKIKTPVA